MGTNSPVERQRMSKLRRPSPSLVVATAALVVALAGVTYAAIPGPDGTVHACYDARGSLRVIDSAATCDTKNGETALNFSQQGPAGPPGQTKLLNFTRSDAIPVARGVAGPVGSFDLPEGNWAITFNGGVRIPGSSALSLNFTRTRKLHSAAAVDFFRARAFSWGANVSCSMALGDGSVRTSSTVGTSYLIGLLLPAVKKQAGGGGGAGKTQNANLNLQLVQKVAPGGTHVVVSCMQGKALPGFASPSAQVHDISIQAVQVNDVGNLNFTPGR
jgi:hypothetical protein